MDREADSFEFLAKAQELVARHVIRSAHDRVAEEIGICLRSAISTLEPQFFRTISVSSRKPSSRAHAAKEHPSRNARSAAVAVAGKRLTVLRPRNTRHETRSIELMWFESGNSNHQKARRRSSGCCSLPNPLTPSPNSRPSWTVTAVR